MKGLRLLRRLAAALRPENYQKSFAQCGEDLIVSYIFARRGIAQPTYLDVGAHHPFYVNNTALFYQKGSYGINIEPNPSLLKEFTRERPLDINLNIGVSSEAGLKEFFCMEDATLSTFSPTDAQEYLKKGLKLKSKLQLPVEPLNKIVSEYWNGQFPDFLTLDVEGMEKEILNTIDFSSSHPKVICLETAEYSPTGDGAKRRDLMALVESKGYILYADTNLNSIYVEKSFWRPAPDERSELSTP